MLPPAPRRGLACRHARPPRGFDGKRGLDKNLPPLNLRHTNIARHVALDLCGPR